MTFPTLFNVTYNVDARLVCFRFPNRYRASAIHYPTTGHYELVIFGPHQNIVLTPLCEGEVLNHLSKVSRFKSLARP